jgi:hypothetical protein
MTPARAELQALIIEVLKEAAAKWPEHLQAELRRLSAPLFVGRLQRMESEDSAKNLRLFQICGFFETVGYVARAGYITVDDVISLLGVWFKTAAMVFRPYIQDLLSARGADPSLFENFLWIVSEIERREATSLEA